MTPPAGPSPRHRLPLALLGALLLATSTSAHAAESIAEGLRPTETNGCYGRTYSASHLAAHPRQQVAEIYLIPAREGMNKPGGPLSVMLAVKLKGGADYMVNGIICPPGGGSLTCKLEDDGGTVTLSVRDGGRLAVEPGPNGIGVEGPSGMETIARPESDDRLFLLDPVPLRTCQDLVRPK